jgi:predicted amidophosphoribosyltransferase
VARNLRAGHLTGTAITVIIALLILLPKQAIVAIRFLATTGTCHVCGRGISRPARYCPHCGSRTAHDSR